MSERVSRSKKIRARSLHKKARAQFETSAAGRFREKKSPRICRLPNFYSGENKTFSLKKVPVQECFLLIQVMKMSSETITRMSKIRTIRSPCSKTQTNLSLPPLIALPLSCVDLWKISLSPSVSLPTHSHLHTLSLSLPPSLSLPLHRV
jgi:hypothetical protein